MKDKQYYIELADRYFEAETTVAEEKELLEFLAYTDDADFEEVKVVMGFFVTKTKAETKPKTRTRTRSFVLHRLALTAAAVILALIIVVPAMVGRSSSCVMIADGERTTDGDVVMSEMDRQMAMLFSNDEDNSVESEMALIFN